MNSEFNPYVTLINVKHDQERYLLVTLDSCVACLRPRNTVVPIEYLFTVTGSGILKKWLQRGHMAVTLTSFTSNQCDVLKC
jgi:hypothetical protein